MNQITITATFIIILYIIVSYVNLSVDQGLEQRTSIENKVNDEFTFR